MKKLAVLMSVCVVTVSGMTLAQETTTTQIESPDGTVTTVVSPSAPVAATKTESINIGGGTTLVKDVPVVVEGKDNVPVVQSPVAVDAMTGQPVEEKVKKESLRDRVRSKME